MRFEYGHHELTGTGVNKSRLVMLYRTLSRIVRSFAKGHSRGRFSQDGKPLSPAGSSISVPVIDLDYLVDPANRRVLDDNIRRRNCENNLDRIVELYQQLRMESNSSKKEKLMDSLREETFKIPNLTHPRVMEYGDEPRLIKTTGEVKRNYEAKEFHVLANNLNLLRTEELTSLTGRRSYYFLGDLAELEHALVKYSISKLLRRNFRLMSVPDILPADVIDSCGMDTKGVRTQVFQLEECQGRNLCLSGTAEMGLAGLHANSVIDVNDLPVCLASVSRCHRAELSTVKEEQGLFRVHHFTKVEMFGLSHPDRSEELFQTFADIQEEIFTSLGLDFNILDMPMNDLGNPAYRKFDVEAWFPGRGIYGEVSSCSNCTDYQSRRLNIRYRDKDKIGHVHTVNGTACAVPRTAMAIFETHQLADGSVTIPEPLRPFFDGRRVIQRETDVAEDREKSKEIRSL